MPLRHRRACLPAPTSAGDYNMTPAEVSAALQASQPLHHLRAQKKKPAEAAVAALAPSQGSEEEEADWNADDDDEELRLRGAQALAE